MPRSREIGASATDTIVVLIGLSSGPTRTGISSFGPKPLPPESGVTTGTGRVEVDVVRLLPGWWPVVRTRSGG